MALQGYSEDEINSYLESIENYKQHALASESTEIDKKEKKPSHLHPIAKAIASFAFGYWLGKLLKQITKLFFIYLAGVAATVYLLKLAKVIEIDYEKLEMVKSFGKFCMYWVISKWERIKKHKKVLESLISLSGGFSSGFYFALRR